MSRRLRVSPRPRSVFLAIKRSSFAQSGQTAFGINAPAAREIKDDVEVWDGEDVWDDVEVVLTMVGMRSTASHIFLFFLIVKGSVLSIYTSLAMG